jgi:hypothetical protein
VLGLAGVAAYFYTRKTSPSTQSLPVPAPVTGSGVTSFNDVNLNSSADFLTSISNGVSSVLNSGARGIRNNNPTNMKWSSAINWQGQIGKDSGGFIIFDTPENGIRAATKNLKSYAKAGLVTVEQIIKRWSETDQAAYIKNVSKALGISSNQAVSVAQYPLMLAAMIRQENGSQPYSMSTIIAGVNAA